MSYIKAQKDWTPADALPGLEVSDVRPGRSGEGLLIAPGRKKGPGQSRNDAQSWVCLVIKVKSDAAESSIA